jgi:hypothetical protein
MPVTITRTPWIDDDGSGTTGTVINNAVKTELYNQIDEGFALLDVEAAGDLTVPGNITAGGNVIADAMYEAGRQTPMGYPINVPFNASDFSAASPLVWTVAIGDIATNAYSVIGKQVTWQIVVIGGTLSGSAGPHLKLRMPAGLSAAAQMRGPIVFTVSGIEVPGFWYFAFAGITELQIYPVTGSIPTGATGLFLNMTFWIS